MSTYRVAETTVLDLVRAAVRSMPEYTPAQDPNGLANRLGVPVEQLVKLDANENPYGPSPRVAEALARFRLYHIYPDPEQERARALTAQYVNVPPEHIVLGNGSDELIDLVMRVFLEPGDEVIDFSPTFGMFAYDAHLCGARVVDVPRDDDFQLRLDEVVRAVTPRTKLILLANPNNPTGTLCSNDVVRRLAETGRIVLVDEAYAEFSGQTAIPLALEYPNVVVLRTFSKWAGLAGLRIGFGVFPRPIAAQIWKIKQPFNVNAAAVVALQATLEDIDTLRQAVQRILQEKQRLKRALEALPGVRVYPSAANFFLVELASGRARAVRDALMERGIIVRYFDKPRIDRCLRISVGRPEHTDALVAALRAMEL
ncbi:MAG TPA: histidinol-phosphate transaminase [Chloroflexota bacterium]